MHILSEKVGACLWATNQLRDDGALAVSWWGFPRTEVTSVRQMRRSVGSVLPRNILVLVDRGAAARCQMHRGRPGRRRGRRLHGGRNSVHSSGLRPRGVGQPVGPAVPESGASRATSIGIVLILV